MNAFFEMRTIFVMSSLVLATLAICYIYIYSARKTYPGFGLWTAAAIVGTVGIALISLRGVLPDFITIILANTLILSAIIILNRGLIRFCHKSQMNALDASSILIMIVGFFILTYIFPDIRLRIICISMLAALYWGRGAVAAYLYLPHVLLKQNYFLVGVLAILAVHSAIQAISTYFFETPLTDLLQAGVLQGSSMAFQTMARLILLIGMISLNSQRLELALAEARKEIKILEGLLPICANCKKIRDENDRWQHMEIYITDHASVEFTHGLCPECLRTLYPEFAEEILLRGTDKPRD